MLSQEENLVIRRINLKKDILLYGDHDGMKYWGGGMLVVGGQLEVKNAQVKEAEKLLY